MHIHLENHIVLMTQEKKLCLQSFPGPDFSLEIGKSNIWVKFDGEDGHWIGLEV